MQDAPQRDADAQRIRALIGAYRNGEDPDLTALSRALWELLYALIPALTTSMNKNKQHRVLELYLVDIGLPRSADLQYVAGPPLWFAREKHVLPPARGDDADDASWTLNERLYEEVRGSLEEGRIAYEDWMTNALKSVLAEQQ